jgi:predicted RNase H-like HicB family nuclease
MHYVGILDGKDDVWGVRIHDIDGCVGAGATPEEAIEDVTDALRWVAEHKISNGFPMPDPSPIAAVLASGEVDAGEALVMIPVSLDVPAS